MPVKLNSSGGGSVTIDTPSTASNLSLTLPSSAGTLARTADLPSGFGFKNRIINGAMVIDQRNAGASVTITGTNASDYVLDRWFARASSATGSKISVQRSTVAPAGFINSQLVTSLSAYTIGATEHFAVMQSIEGFNVADLGWGTANAQTITISFKVRSSLTGTFGGFITNSAGNRCYVFSYTINSANTFEDKSVTIAGDTSGTWLTDNGVGLTISFSVGAGSSTTGSAGSWGSTLLRSVTGQTSLVGTNGATFYITGVQLEVGSTATSFDYRPYGTELALCQRYCMVYINSDSINQRHAQGVANATIYCQITFPFKVTMRTSPSVSINTIGNLRLADTATAESTPTAYAISTTTTGANLGSVAFDSSGLTTYRQYYVTGNGTLNSAQITFSAEL